MRRKFRRAVGRFVRRLRKQKIVMQLLALNNNLDKEAAKKALYEQVLQDDDDSDDQRKQFKALHALDILEKQRRDKEMKLKFLQDKCSNPAFFAVQAFTGKKPLLYKRIQSLKLQSSTHKELLAQTERSLLAS